MRKSFTINPLRKKEEILSYYELFDKNLYQGIEIFYPYAQKKEQYDEYTKSIFDLLHNYPYLEVVMHLPHSKENSLCENQDLENAIEIMKNGIVYASQFNVHKLTLHLGYVDKEKPRSYYLPHLTSILQDLCDYAAKYDMYVMVENMPNDIEYGYSPKELKTLFEKVNKNNIKLIFDFGHANCTQYKIDEYLDMLKEYLFHLHLSDNNSHSDEHKRLGLGNIDYYHVLEKLKQINYENLYTMEVIYKTKDELEMFAYDLDKYDN